MKTTIWIPFLVLSVAARPGEAVDVPGPSTCAACDPTPVDYAPSVGSLVSLPGTNMVSDRVSLDSSDAEIDLGTTCKKNNAHPTGAIDTTGVSDVTRVSWVTRAPAVDATAPNSATVPKTQVYVRALDGSLPATMVSEPLGGGVPAGYSEMPRFDEDGKWLIFTSISHLLTTEDMAEAPKHQDVFVYEIGTGTVSRISETPISKVGGDGPSGGVPGISPDGRYVVFQSEATNLQSFTTPCTVTPGLYLKFFPNGKSRRKNLVHVYLRDRGADLTDDSDDCIEWITHGFDGGGSCALPNGASDTPTVSAGGCRVAFSSGATNLLSSSFLPFMTPKQVYLRDRDAGTITLVSADTLAGPADADCNRPMISPDGEWVVFESRATDLVAGDTNGLEDVFVYDVAGGSLARVSLDAGGSQLTGIKSVCSAISGNGRFVVYTRSDPSATNIYELWVVDRDPDDDGDYTNAYSTKKISTASDGVSDSDGWSGGNPFTLTTTGEYVFYMSVAENLGAVDTNSTCVPCPPFDCDEGRDIYLQELY